MSESNGQTTLVDRLLMEIQTKRRLILFIGDVLLDRWVHGKISDCQDGCPKFTQDQVVITPGGAANAQNSIQHWGVQTALYGYALNDCPIKTRYVEDGKIILRVDDDGNCQARGDAYLWCRAMALEMTEQAGVAAVLISDYDKGFLSREFIKVIAETCKRRGIPCVADCKRAPDFYNRCILKGNEQWFDTHRANTAKCTIKGLVVTFGDKMPIAVTNGAGGDSSEKHMLSAVMCVNHVGAGDCFAAHLALALACGFSLRDAATLAHSAGRVYVRHPHNRPPYPVEVAADMQPVDVSV